MSELLIENVMILGCLGGVGLVLAFLGYANLRGSGAAKQDEIALAARGISTEAEILNQNWRRIWTRRLYSVSYFITFRYTVTAPDDTKKDYTCTKEIRAADYRRLRIGDHIGIRYLPERPETSSIESGAQAVISAATIRLLGVAMLAAGGGLVVFGMWFSGQITQTVTQKAATSTAYALRASETPDPLQITSTAQFAQNATSTVQAEKSTTDKLGQAIAARLPEWKKVSDQVVHRVLPPDTGLNMNEAEIDYGYCSPGHFYVYVWLDSQVFNLKASTWTVMGGYAYVENSTPGDCRPVDLLEPGFHQVQGNWFAAATHTIVAETPTPAQ